MQVKKSFWGKKPGFDIGDILHIGANIGFVAVIFAMVVYWGLAPLAVLLVVLSKWRVLAVQPRFWLPNIKANLVDVIVGVSTIILAHQASIRWVSLVWIVLYVCWLLFLKPQSQEIWVGLQSFWAQLVGLLSIFMAGSLLNQPFLVCALAWLISWAAARHYFSNYEEPHYRSLGLVWGFLVAQMVWVSLHWIQYYEVFSMKISITAIIVSIMSASLGGIYHAYKKDTLQRGVLIENSLFGVVLIAVILATAKFTAQS